MQQPSKIEQFAASFKDEAALRHALVALLELMPDTSNVRHTHGPGERGKDIVFDSAGPFGQTYLIACVVKNEKITGSADSNSGARNVYNQAEQALGLRFTDTQGQEQQVSQAFVISPAECSTTAIESIKDKLQNNGRRVTFICGPQLLDLFERYYPDFLLFHSGLFGSYVAALQQEFENDEPISNVLFRSGFASRQQVLSSVYVRPSFFQTFQRFKLSLPIPKIDRLKAPLQEYVVQQIQTEVRRLAQFALGRLSPDPEARQLQADLLRYATDIAARWQEAIQVHSRRRDLPPEEQSAPRRTLRLEIKDAGLFRRGEDLMARCRELLTELERQIAAAHRYLRLDFDSPHSALQSELAKDAFELEALSQEVPTILVPDRDRVKRIGIGKNVLDLIGRDLLIVGPAGLGKSSFCRSQAIHDFGRLRDGSAEIWPAYVALHQLADGPLNSFEECFLRNVDLIQLWREARGGDGVNKRFRLYLDGLDEIPSVTRQAEILSLARAAKANFDVQLVVTSREHVTGPHLRDLLRIRISEFEDEQIEEFLGKWFGDNQAELSEFKTQLSKVPSLHEVMRVPLLATLVLGVYRNTKALPESRVSLYEMFLRLLAGGWDIAKRVNRETQFGPTPKLTVLIRLASLLHVGRRRDANEGDLKSAINQTLPGLLDSRYSLLDELVQDGFLVPAGPNYTFAHLSFQEFLTAKDLFEPGEQKATHAFDQYLSGDDWWREVALFYVALSGKPKQLENFIRKIARKRLARTGDTSIARRVHLLLEQMMLAFPGCNPSFQL